MSDTLDEAFSALGCLRDYHAGDTDIAMLLENIETALHYAMKLENPDG